MMMFTPPPPPPRGGVALAQPHSRAAMIRERRGAMGGAGFMVGRGCPPAPPPVKGPRGSMSDLLRVPAILPQGGPEAAPRAPAMTGRGRDFSFRNGRSG